MILAVLGGSFDPFHNGHLAIVKSVLSRRLAERVLVIPAARSPHKPPPQGEGRHRLQMARLALADVPEAEVLSLELDRGGVSYTVDTLQTLSERTPDDVFRLILGADNLDDFHLWRQPDRILQLAELIVFARPGFAGDLPARIRERAYWIGDFDVPISATDVRAELASGGRATGLVPEPVLVYIGRHSLYRGADDRIPSEGL